MTSWRSVVRAIGRAKRLADALQSEHTPEKAPVVLFFNEALLGQVGFVNLTVSHRQSEHETFVIVLRVRLDIDLGVIKHAIAIELFRLIAKKPSQHVCILSANPALDLRLLTPPRAYTRGNFFGWS